jgi:hypothetical protein
VYPLDGAAPRRIPESEGMSPVGWPGPRTVIARDATPVPARLFRFDLASGRRSPWRDLAPADRSGIRRLNSVSVAGEGEAYAYSYTRQVSDLYSVTGLR